MGALEDVSNSAPTDSAPTDHAVLPLKKKKSLRKGKSTRKKRGDSNDTVASIQGRVLERLNQAVYNTTPSMNRSPELIPLTMEWEAAKKKLRILVTLTTDYAESTRTMHESRSKLVDHFTQLSANSPLYDTVGKNTLDDISTEAIQSIRDELSTNQTMTVTQIIESWDDGYANSIDTLQLLASTQGQVQLRGFRDHVIKYAVEWEKTVTEKVEEELEKVRALQTTRSHYEKKVEQLRKLSNDAERKGKENSVSQEEKLKRNEAKLQESFELHERAAGRLCVLLEEAMKHGWKDLYHFVKYFCKWESNRVDQEREIYSRMMSISLESMKSTFKEDLMTNKTKKKKSRRSLPEMC